MSENMLALKAGDADVIQVFQPYAAELTQGGGAYLWYAAASRGPTSYTTLNTTRDYAQRHPETLTAMCRAMYRTQKWIAAHDGRALAQAISSYFPHVPADTLAACYEHYRELGVWNSAPLMSREGLNGCARPAWRADACGRESNTKSARTCSLHSKPSAKIRPHWARRHRNSGVAGFRNRSQPPVKRGWLRCGPRSSPC